MLNALLNSDRPTDMETACSFDMYNKTILPKVFKYLKHNLHWKENFVRHKLKVISSIFQITLLIL